MSWIARHPSHSIETTRFVWVFEEEITSKMVLSLGHMLEETSIDHGFQPKQIADGIQFNFDLSHNKINPQAPAGPSGKRITLNRLSTQGHVIETIVLDNKTILYETSDYSSWTNYMSRIEKLLKPVLNELMGITDFSILTLQYVDRFIYKGDASEADPTPVINRDLLNCLQPDIIPNGMLWHLHRGWYSYAEPVGRLLINYNVDLQEHNSADVDGSEKIMRSLQMLTRIDAKAQLVNINDERLLYSMHQVAKVAFRDSLTEEYQRVVGLLSERGD